MTFEKRHTLVYNIFCHTMGDEALVEKTINTLNKVGEITHLLLIYIKKTQFIMFLTVLNGKILKNMWIILHPLRNNNRLFHH